jgi:hypothetical protein
MRPAVLALEDRRLLTSFFTVNGAVGKTATASSVPAPRRPQTESRITFDGASEASKLSLKTKRQSRTTDSTDRHGTNLMTRPFSVLVRAARG